MFSIEINEDRQSQRRDSRRGNWRFVKNVFVFDEEYRIQRDYELYDAEDIPSQARVYRLFQALQILYFTVANYSVNIILGYV